MMNILYVQFSDTSTVRAIVTLTNEIQLIKVPVLPSSLTLIKHRSVLCVKMIYYPVITFFFFFLTCLCLSFRWHDNVPVANKSNEAWLLWIMANVCTVQHSSFMSAVVPLNKNTKGSCYHHPTSFFPKIQSYHTIVMSRWAENFLDS